MSRTRAVTLTPAMIDTSIAAVRRLIEDLRNMPIELVAAEYAELNGRLRTLGALGLIDADQENELFRQANEARQIAEES